MTQNDLHALLALLVGNIELARRKATDVNSFALALIDQLMEQVREIESRPDFV